MPVHPLGPKGHRRPGGGESATGPDPDHALLRPMCLNRPWNRPGDHEIADRSMPHLWQKPSVLRPPACDHFSP